MSLLIGQHISPEELEQMTSTWSSERFASMCNTVIWAASGRAFQESPAFTTRVNVKDGGIDAEWEIEIPEDNRHIPTPILGPGWNVFQYKKRDVLAHKRQPIMTRLRSSLVGALKDIEENFGRKPNRYVLFVNIHFTPDEKASLKKSIGNDDKASTTHVEVIGAAEIAVLLNDHPHLRASFFTPMAFQTWESAYSSHRSKKQFRSQVELIGRESEVDRLRALVDAPHIRAIVVSGPHDMGKSRLALEATKHKPYDTAVALDPRSTGLADYRNLCTNRSEAICIVEDPELDTLQPLIGEALSVPGLKLLITFPTISEVQDLSYGFDNRVESLPLAPLNDENARKLLQATGKFLDYGIRDWILGQAGGVPGIILAAASIAGNLRRDHTAFSTAIGKEFERRIVKEFDETTLQSARLLSVLTHVGTSGPHEAEFQTIHSLFGNGSSPHELLVCLPELEKAGLAKRAGYYSEVSLPLLANHLVEQLLQGRKTEMFALFARLDEAGQIRFIKRLAQIKGPEAEQFWDELLAQDGLLGTLENILKRPHLLRIVAGTTPQRVLHVLENTLLKSTRETRLAISGYRRRELMWALEQLLFRTTTSKGALRLVWLLAQAENETWGDNATGVLQECFLPFHPQLPLSLHERASLIQEFLSSSSTAETKLTVIKAIERALMNRRSSVYLRHSGGTTPLDTSPTLTWGDIFDYLRHLAEILIALAKEEGEVSRTALGVLPDSIAKLAFHGLTKESKQHFRLLTDWALSERQGLEVSALTSAISRVEDFYATKLSKPDISEARKREYSDLISELAKLRDSIDHASFPIKLKQLMRGGPYRGTEGWTHVREQLRLLGKQVVQSPELLTPNLWEWLLTASPPGAWNFFYTLGQEDHLFHFRSTVETQAKAVTGNRAFAPYFAGWAKRDLEGAESRLDQLAELRAVAPTSLLETTSCLDPTPRGLKRMNQVAPEDPEYAAAILGRWTDRLDLKEFKELLQIIAGTSLEHASAAVDLLGSWIYHQKPFDDELSDFAWRCIEQGPTKKPTRFAGGWHFDQLASTLTEANPDLGFKKFQELLMASLLQASEWDPLDMDGGEQWWKTLRTKDRQRLFRILLATSRTDDHANEMLSWRLKDLLDQEQDADDFFNAIGNEDAYARIAAKWLVGSKPNFWDLAFGLLKQFPHDHQVQGALTSATMDTEAMIEGPGSRFYETRKQEIQKRLEDSSTPTEALTWLRDVAETLSHEVKTNLAWEYDIEINDLKRYIHGEDVDQKRWAIGRILKYAQWSDVRKLLTVDEIEEALPYIALHEPRRTMIERLLPTWKHAG